MDGFGSLNGESGEFTFEEPGFYHICLTVFDEVSGCAAEHCRTIEIKGQEGESNNLCRADFTFFVDGNTVNVNNESQGVISEYNWNFNDEGFASSANETFTLKVLVFMRYVLVSEIPYLIVIQDIVNGLKFLILVIILMLLLV
jgi:hypothetical protein